MIVLLRPAKAIIEVRSPYFFIKYAGLVQVLIQHPVEDVWNFQVLSMVRNKVFMATK